MFWFLLATRRAGLSTPTRDQTLTNCIEEVLTIRLLGGPITNVFMHVILQIEKEKKQM